VVQDALVTTVEPGSELEKVWRTHAGVLWRSLVAYAGDPDVAADAMADAFAQALGRREAIRDPGAWIWRASFKIAAGELARRRRELGDGTEPRLPAEIPDTSVDLVRALRRLSPNQRAAAILRWYVDLPTREVAKVLGCSQATVRVHLSQAKRRLRPLLEEDRDA
jgi:RNA polymerase sigma factor (sigma-70 family)